MNRRAFLGGSVAWLARSQVGHAQRLPTVGYLSNSSGDSAPDRAFFDGLRELGRIDGKTVTFEKRFSAGRSEAFSGFASELLRLNVEAIAAWSPSAVAAARNLTHTVPIVGISMGDPVAQGWASSLRNPGGNVTGVANLQSALSAKRIELVKEVVPTATRVGLLVNPTSASTADVLEPTRSAARSRGIQLTTLTVSDPNGFETAFSDARVQRSGAVIVLPDAMYWAHRHAIVMLAAKNRLPTIYWAKDYVDVGGLMSYAASLNDMGRRAAYFVDAILRGTKPDHLPIEQPTKFELVINLKTAKALGLTIPPSLLLRADQVIE